MSQEVFIRGMFSGIVSLFFAFGVFSQYDSEVGDEVSETDRQKYRPYLPGYLLPSFLLALAVLAGAVEGFAAAAKMTLSMCFDIFLHISVYYVVLLALLPLLRRHISARACAMLWVIPNFLYIVSQSYMRLPEPLLVIRAPGNTVWIVFGVWFFGFATVMVWKIVQHLLFRHYVLRDAAPITDEKILSSWKELAFEARLKKAPSRLMLSPVVSTPLSVGLFRCTTRVILPERSYTPEELNLILKHELIHISREDAWSKFFLVFCTAMCWFNPLMWYAMKKSADDMELSCDETVLLDADGDTRRKYAALLLNSAGDERGFTTCLSASAKTMRYRLKNITKPQKRGSGAIVVGVVFFALCMTSGYVSLAYGGGSGGSLIYDSGDLGEYNLRYISMEDDPYNTTYEIADQQAFHAYLAGLSLTEFTGNYSFSESSREFTYLLDAPKGTLGITLTDNAIRIIPITKDPETYSYYIPGGVDWDYLNTVIVARPAMNAVVSTQHSEYGHMIRGGLSKLWRIRNDEKILVYDGGYEADGAPGVFGNSPYNGYKEIRLEFSWELAEPCSAWIETWDRSEGYMVTQEDITEPLTFTVPKYAAHYTVYASFRDESGELYQAEFQWDIGDI